MTVESGVVLAGVVQLLAIGGAWGHMVAVVKTQREIANERHKENLDRLDEIRQDVKEINGTVRGHTAEIRSIIERRQ